MARIPARFNTLMVSMSSSFFIGVIMHVGEMIVNKRRSRVILKSIMLYLSNTKRAD